MTDLPPGFDEAVERALKRVDEDVRDRLIVFDGGGHLLPWVDAHKHHADEPYIGCVFCQDKFLPILPADSEEGEELVERALRGYEDENTRGYEHYKPHPRRRATRAALIAVGLLREADRG